MSLLRSRHALVHLALMASHLGDLHQSATEANPDPAVRRRALTEQIAALAAQRDALDRGETPLVNHQELVDKVAAVVQLTDRIPTDIARYGEHMHANTAALLRHT